MGMGKTAAARCKLVLIFISDMLRQLWQWWLTTTKTTTRGQNPIKKRTYLTTCALQHVCTKATHLVQAASSIKLKLIKTLPFSC